MGKAEGINPRQILGVLRAKSQSLFQAPSLHHLRKITHFPLFSHSSSFIVVLAPRASVSPGNLLKIQITGPTLDLLNQKFWGWNTAICVQASVLH